MDFFSTFKRLQGGLGCEIYSNIGQMKYNKEWIKSPRM